MQSWIEFWRSFLYKDTILLYLYNDSHYKDKTVLWLSYLYDENPYTWKEVYYIEYGTPGPDSI